MDITYSAFNSDKKRKKHRRIIGIIVLIIVILSGLYALGIITNGKEYTERSEIIQENHALRERVTELEEKVSELEKELEAIPVAEPEVSPSATPIIPRG